MGLWEVEEAIENGTHPHFKPNPMSDTNKETAAPFFSPNSTKPAVKTTLLDPPYSPDRTKADDPEGSIRKRWNQTNLNAFN